MAQDQNVPVFGRKKAIIIALIIHMLIPLAFIIESFIG